MARFHFILYARDFSHPRAAGNALFLILIAVALFAALSYAITQSSRGGGGDAMREKELLLSSRIVQYGSAVQTAVNRLRLINDCGDTRISFESPATGVQYRNPTAPFNKLCHVFDTAGGGVSFMKVDPDILDSAKVGMPLYGEVYFTGQSNLVGAGTDSACVDPAFAATKELIMFVPYIKESACREMAKGSGTLTAAGNIPQIINIAYDNRANLSVPFRGVYANSGWCGMGINSTSFDFSKKYSGCFRGNTLPDATVLTYYQVLIVR